MGGENSMGHQFGKKNSITFGDWYVKNGKHVEDAYFKHLCRASQERFEPDSLHDFAHDMYKVRTQDVVEFLE